MKKNCRRNELKAEVLHENGQIKIRVATSTKRMASRKVPIHFEQGRNDGGYIIGIPAKRQPEPIISGLTKRMVCEHVSKLIENGVLGREPKSLPEWLLAEWHLARELNLTRLRLAHFVSEIVCDFERRSMG